MDRFERPVGSRDTKGWTITDRLRPVARRALRDLPAADQRTIATPRSRCVTRGPRYLRAGRGPGVVFRGDQPSYRTAFVEALPAQADTFLRGEGSTIPKRGCGLGAVRAAIACPAIRSRPVRGPSVPTVPDSAPVRLLVFESPTAVTAGSEPEAVAAGACFIDDDALVSLLERHGNLDSHAPGSSQEIHRGS